MPELYIITGSNGAGKSTIGPDYLPQHIRNTCTIFDGDKLFIQKRNELWNTIQAPKEAKKLAYEYVVETFEQNCAIILKSKHSILGLGHVPE